MIISIRLYMSLTLWHRQFRNPIFLVLWTCYSEVQLVTSAAVSLLGALRAAWSYASREWPGRLKWAATSLFGLACRTSPRCSRKRSASILQFTTFETHNSINYIFRSARKRVLDLGAATGAYNLSGVVDVWAGDTAGTTTRESARYHRLGNSAPHK